MQSIKKIKPHHPLLLGKVEAIIFWRRSNKLTASELFLPNNICGLGFTLSGELYVKYNNEFVLMPVFGTRNTLEKPSEIKTTGDFLNISIRLALPTTISIFTKVPLNELYENSYFSLTDIFSEMETSLVIEQLLEKDSDEEKQTVMENFLVKKLIENTNFKLSEIINFIHSANGNISVYDLSKLFTISERTIHRYFNRYVGINPIHYINLIKFRSIINLSQSQNLNLLDEALQVGYYDQSHFIKHFKGFTSLTPKQFFELKNITVLSDFYNT